MMEEITYNLLLLFISVICSNTSLVFLLNFKMHGFYCKIFFTLSFISDDHSSSVTALLDHSQGDLKKEVLFQYWGRLFLFRFIIK